MTGARERIAARPRTNSDVFDIEEIQREVRETVARQAAEALARSNAQKLAAIAAEDALRKAWWMGIAGDVVKWAVILVLTGLFTLLWTAIKHAP